MLSVDEWKEYRKNIEKMENTLKQLPKVSEGKKAIYVFHNPPFGVGLDVCIDKTTSRLKSNNRLFDKNNAYMSLHGNIHESYKATGIWKNELNGTICIQTGQT